MTKTNKKGFTLVELIIVIAILAILVAALAPALIKYIEKSRVSKDESSLDNVFTAIKTAMANETVNSGVTQSNDWRKLSDLVSSDKAITSGTNLALARELFPGDADTTAGLAATSGTISVEYAKTTTADSKTTSNVIKSNTYKGCVIVYKIYNDKVSVAYCTKGDGTDIKYTIAE